MLSYFTQSCKYFLINVSLTDSVRIGALCRAKYPRGVNLVVVPLAEVGRTFTPHFIVDPGRYFLTYERLVTEALEGDPLPEQIKTQVRTEIDNYDPEKELVWLFVIGAGGDQTELQVFVSKINQ